MKNSLRALAGVAAALMLMTSGAAQAVDDVSIDTSPTGLAPALSTGIFDNIRVVLGTETAQYQTGAALAAGDIFVDRGFASVTAFQKGATGAGGTYGAAIGEDPSTANMGIVWEGLQGSVTNVFGGTLITTQYDAGTQFNFYHHQPGYTLGTLFDNAGTFDIAGDINTIQGGVNVLTMESLGGTGTINFDSSGNFLNGSFALQFEITNALAGFWFNETTGEDFADILVGTKLILGFVTAGTITPPPPATDGTLPSGFADSVSGQDFAFRVLSGHDGSFRFQTQAVPEPSTLALMGLALVLVAGFANAGLRRRRNDMAA